MKKDTPNDGIGMKEIQERFKSLETLVSDMKNEIEELQVLTNKLLDVGVAISAETDLYKLLTRIIEEAKGLLKAENGTLYLVDEQKGDLYFHVTDAEYLKRVRIPIDENSISGYVAKTGNVLNIEDVYLLKGTPYHFNKEYDKYHNYRTRSMLTVPMVNHEGRITGAVQLINKRTVDGSSTIFNDRDQRILLSLASQAAVSIDNAQLYKEVGELLSAIVKFSASAIDERDPATAGHSRRVAGYSVAIAKAMNRFSDEQIKEIEYAAWLHDVGKIGVREHILVKENKLYPDQLGKIIERFHGASASMQLHVLKKDDAAKTTSREIEEDIKFVERINHPGFLKPEDRERLEQIAAKTYTDPDGKELRLLQPDEVEALGIARGNLTEAERRIMNAHVTSTHRILSRIPFTRSLRAVPRIASAHHERLDGTGYPNGLKGDNIPIQARILALADVFDALAAQDRPYKPAVPIDRCLMILDEESQKGLLDREIYELFLKEKIYELPDPGADQESAAL